MDASLAPSLNPIRPEAEDEIPVIDLGPYLRGEVGALERTANEVGHAMENVGFYFIVNHGVPQALVDRTFEAAARFHAQPLEDKMSLKIDENIVGYLPMQGATVRHSALNANNKPNLNEAFFLNRQLSPDHPDVVASKPFRVLNRWPEKLPGFREDVMEYISAAEQLGRKLVPLYAVALGLPAKFFDAAFVEPTFALRLSHYPAQEVVENNEFGLAPHTDTSFMTLLPENKVPGLSVRMANGSWVDAPVLEGSFLVNGGDLLRRWSNDRFLATPHRVINRSGQERYAIPFFMDCRYDHRMECLPTCHGAGNPPHYEPITYPEYKTWYRNRNYDAPPTSA
jgi:isopenicillin N synthase-like dioxygenase